MYKTQKEEPSQLEQVETGVKSLPIILQCNFVIYPDITGIYLTLLIFFVLWIYEDCCCNHLWLYKTKTFKCITCIRLRVLGADWSILQTLNILYSVPS